MPILLFLLRFTIFITPLYLARFNVFGLPTTVLELSIFALFIVWLAIKIKKRGGSFRTFNDKWFIPIILIFFGATLSAIFSRNLILSAGIWKGYFLDPLLFFIVFIDAARLNEDINKVKRIDFINNILFYFLLSGFFTAAVSLAYLFTGHMSYDGRLSAFYLSPNHLAMFLAPAFLINFYFIVAKKRYRGLFYGMFIVLGSVIYFTRSFGAITGLAAAVLIWLLVESRLLIKLRRFLTKKVLYGCFAVFLIIIMTTVYFSFSADYFDAVERSSFHSRIIIWKSSAKIIKDNFILGIGPGMFQEYYLEYQKYFPPYLEWAVPQPHNIFLAFWLQAGIIGLFGFIWLLWIIIAITLKTAIAEFRVTANKNTVNENENNEIFYLLLSFILYFIIHGLVDTTYWKNDLSVIFWFFIGIIIIAARIKSDNKKWRE